MKILLLPITFAFLIFSHPVLAQEAGDSEAIRATVNNYFEGLRDGDRSKLEKAFLDTDSHVKYVRNGNVRSMGLKQALDSFSSRKRPNLKGHILSIDIYHPDAAFVTYDYNDTYIDGFQLIKADGNWRIINKTFVDK